MAHDIAERLREGVKRVGEAEPLIGVGLAMGRAADYLADTYDSVKRVVKRRLDPPRDIVLPKERKPARKVAPIQRSLMRRSR